MTHEIIETDQGLVLEVEGSPVARIWARPGNGTLDLIWSIHGPQDLERARATIAGLLDLVVHYDALKTKEKKAR